MEKSAFLKDNNGNIIQAIIQINDDIFSIRMFNEHMELLGYMNFQIQKNNRIFLSEIYCYDQYRSLGIASKLSQLGDYVLKDYQGYIIRGVYFPTEMSTDREISEMNMDELDLRARRFYEKNGYKIINYEEYIMNKNKYRFLDSNLDFKINNQRILEIVYKIIEKQEYNYYEDNGLIYYNDNIKRL